MDYHLTSASLIYLFIYFPPLFFFFFFFFLAALARHAEISPRFRLVRHRRLGVNVLKAATVTRWPDVQSDGERPVDTTTHGITVFVALQTGLNASDTILHILFMFN